MYGADPARTGVHPGLRLRPPFRIVWSVSNKNLIEFPAVVSDGIGYIATGRGDIRAFSMRYGNVIWRRATHTVMAASLAIWGDRLVAHDMYGHVRVLDRATGRVLWVKSVGSSIESSPVVRDGVDYFGTRSGRVYALDLRTREGTLDLLASARRSPRASPLDGNTAFVGTYGGQILALDSRTGRLRWSGGATARLRDVARRPRAGCSSRRRPEGRSRPSRPPERGCGRSGRVVRLLDTGGLGRGRRLRLVQRRPVLRVGRQRRRL